ncbi:hypothetical protein BT69DRAFT_1290797 [Atractiella rhizophila]|nr:hypothetical protein BT69DRAFT_1290797 [Atractiella rhizophila]
MAMVIRVTPLFVLRKSPRPCLCGLSSPLSHHLSATVSMDSFAQATSISKATEGQNGLANSTKRSRVAHDNDHDEQTAEESLENSKVKGKRKDEKEKFITCDHCRRNKTRCVKDSQIAACNACKKHGLQCTVGIKRQRKRKNDPGPVFSDQQYDGAPPNRSQATTSLQLQLAGPSSVETRLEQRAMTGALSSHLIQENFKILPNPVSAAIIPNFFLAFENAGRDASRLGPYGEIIAAAHIGSGCHSSCHSALIGRLARVDVPVYFGDLRSFGYTKQNACAALKTRAANLLEESDALTRPSIDTIAVILDVVRMLWMTRVDLADRYFRHALAHWRYFVSLSEQGHAPLGVEWARWMYLFDSTLAERSSRASYVTDQEIRSIIAPALNLPANSFLDPTALLNYDPDAEIKNEKPLIFQSNLVLHRVFGYGIQQIEQRDDPDLTLQVLKNLIRRVDDLWRWLEARRLHDLRVAPNGPSKSFTYYQYYSRRGEFAIRMFRCFSLAEKQLERTFHPALDAFRTQLQRRVDAEIGNFADWLKICHSELILTKPEVTSEFVRSLRLICRVFGYLPGSFSYWERYLKNGPKSLERKLQEAQWVLQVCKPLGFFSKSTADWATKLEEAISKFASSEPTMFTQASLTNPPSTTVVDPNFSVSVRNNQNDIKKYAAALSPIYAPSPPHAQTNHYSPSSPLNSSFKDMPYSPPPSLVDPSSPVTSTALYQSSSSPVTQSSLHPVPLSREGSGYANSPNQHYPSPSSSDSPVDVNLQPYGTHLSNSAASWDVQSSSPSSTGLPHPPTTAEAPGASWDRSSPDQRQDTRTWIQPVMIQPPRLPELAPHLQAPTFPTITFDQSQDAAPAASKRPFTPWRKHNLPPYQSGYPYLYELQPQSQSLPYYSNGHPVQPNGYTAPYLPVDQQVQTQQRVELANVLTHKAV